MKHNCDERCKDWLGECRIRRGVYDRMRFMNTKIVELLRLKSMVTSLTQDGALKLYLNRIQMDCHGEYVWMASLPSAFQTKGIRERLVR